MPQPTDPEILDVIRQSLSAGHHIKILQLPGGQTVVAVQTGFTTVVNARPTLGEALRASIESAMRATGSSA